MKRIPHSNEEIGNPLALVPIALGGELVTLAAGSDATGLAIAESATMLGDLLMAFKEVYRGYKTGMRIKNVSEHLKSMFDIETVEGFYRRRKHRTEGYLPFFPLVAWMDIKMYIWLLEDWRKESPNSQDIVLIPPTDEAIINFTKRYSYGIRVQKVETVLSLVATCTSSFFANNLMSIAGSNTSELLDSPNSPFNSLDVPVKRYSDMLEYMSISLTLNTFTDDQIKTISPFDYDSEKNTGLRQQRVVSKLGLPLNDIIDQLNILKDILLSEAFVEPNRVVKRQQSVFPLGSYIKSKLMSARDLDIIPVQSRSSQFDPNRVAFLNNQGVGLGAAVRVNPVRKLAEPKQTISQITTESALSRKIRELLEKEGSE